MSLKRDVKMAMVKALHIKSITFVFVALMAFGPSTVYCQFVWTGLQSISACDFCLAAQGISPLEVGSTGMRIDVRYLSVGTLYQDGSKTINANRELETHLTQQYSFFYAVASTLSMSALVPVPRRHSEQLAGAGEIVTGNQFGLGDVDLLARYKPYVGHGMESTYIVSVAAGVKLPTGRTDGRDSQGELLDPHVQLGTGSTDFLLGASGFAAIGRTAFILNLLAGIDRKGANGHQFGNTLNYDATVRYGVTPDDYDSPQLFATFSLIGELRGREQQNGLVDDNSGGNVVYVSPGMQLFVTPALTLELSYQQPIIHSLHGQQLGEDYRFVSGIQILF
jgi:hypothetical protein